MAHSEQWLFGNIASDSAIRHAGRLYEFHLTIGFSVSPAMGGSGSLVRNLRAARNGMASLPIKLLGALRSFALGPASSGKLSSRVAAANCCEQLCEAVRAFGSENDRLN